MDNIDLVSKRIVTLANNKNLSINRLATLSGVPTATMSDLVNKKSKNVRFDIIVDICPTLGISVNEFFDFPPYNERPDGSSPKKEMDKWEQLGNALTPQEKERVRRILSGGD